VLGIGLVIAYDDRGRDRDRRQRIDAVEGVRPGNHAQRVRDRLQVLVVCQPLADHLDHGLAPLRADARFPLCGQEALDSALP
jgi:hypothetical protein